MSHDYYVDLFPVQLENSLSREENYDCLNIIFINFQQVVFFQVTVLSSVSFSVFPDIAIAYAILKDDTSLNSLRIYANHAKWLARLFSCSRFPETKASNSAIGRLFVRATDIYRFTEANVNCQSIQ